MHEIRDQAGIIARLVDHAAHIHAPGEAPLKVAKAIASMRQDGRSRRARMRDRRLGQARPCDGAAPLPERSPRIDDDKVKAAANLLGKAKRVLIVVGGGAQDASPEVTLISDMLQAPVLAYRRGRGVLDGRNPFSVTLPLGRELWGEADAVLGIGTRLLKPMTAWGVDNDLQIVRVDTDREEPSRLHKPKVALIGDAAPILRKLIDALAQIPTRAAFAPRGNAGAPGEMAPAPAESSRRSSPSSTSSAPNCRRTASMSTKSRRSALPPASPSRSTSRARFSRPAIRTISAGATPPRSARNMRGPTCRWSSINGDGGFLYTGNELATAMRHRIPLVAVVFADGAFGNVRRIQQEQFGNRLIASDLANPDFVKYAESFGAAGRRARNPAGTGRRAQGGLRCRASPTLIEVPVGPMPPGNSSTCRACAASKAWLP